MATLTGIPAWLASMACIFFAGPILGLVYGNYYREGAAVLALLSIGLFASVCAGSCGIVLAYTGHQKMLMVITIVSSAVTFIAMLAAVKPYGIVGVAMARTAGQILQNGIVLLVVKQKTGMWTHVGFRGYLDYGGSRDDRASNRSVHRGSWQEREHDPGTDAGPDSRLRKRR